MPDESDFIIPVQADVTDAVEGFQQVGESAHEMGEAIKEGAEEGESGLEKVGEAAQESGEQMGEHAEKVGQAISGWQGLMEVIGAGAVAEVMNKISEATMEVGDQMRMMSAVMGTNINDARGFSEALSSLGVNSQAAMMAIRRLEMDAETGGKKLAGLGVSQGRIR